MTSDSRPEQRKASQRRLIAFLIIVPFLLPLTKLKAQTCAAQDPELVYTQMKAKTMAHKTYSLTYRMSTNRGTVWAKQEVEGKYLQTPAVYYEKRIKVEASFPEQAGPGYQEIYTGQDDINRILMPGALKAIGVISMFPEDPKADYLNGENTKRAAIWTWFAVWDRMKEGGKLEVACTALEGKTYWLLTIHRGTNPDPVYHHDTVKISIDPETMFPMKVETYRPGEAKPAVSYTFTNLKLDPPLTPDQLKFEGLTLGWDIAGATIPKGPMLDKLSAPEPKLGPAELEAPAFIEQLDRALAGIKDYETDLTISLRYFRLRQYKTERYRFIAGGNAFSSLNTHLEANYILLNAGEGFRLVFDPAKDKLLHVLPSGVYKVMGESTFPLDDPRLFSALGDDLPQLSFPAVRDQLKAVLAKASSKKAATATSGNQTGPWLEITEADLGLPKHPRIMRLTLDPGTHLPAFLELRGYDDPNAFLTVRFDNTKINSGLTNTSLWK
jgi:outer membrane lipoprotein-sorting protein